MNEQLKKRLKSLIWRAGAVAAVTIAAFFVEPEVVQALNLPQWLVIGVSLAVAEVTKWLNS